MYLKMSNVLIPEGKEVIFDNLPEECSCLYMAIDQQLAAVICIEDPVREEAADVIRDLRENGISKNCHDDGRQ